MAKASPTSSKLQCGLCGATENLTQTECCGNWICDDERKYVAFSYASTSCHRNHRTKTLCRFHYEEGHSGSWQSCAKCRAAFETEMVVHYGTNKFNFEKMQDPPNFEATHCKSCGEVISLGEGGYALRNGEYTCLNCERDPLGFRTTRHQRKCPPKKRGPQPRPWLAERDKS